ncbi:hypothetical protein GF352_00630 [archaeon]|nr:hypothetical protein [archaeon]
MRRLVLVLLFLLLSPAFSKVIISSPKNGAIISRGVINVVGVTDEGGDIALSVYDPAAGVETFCGSVPPDSNGFWNSSIDLSGVNGSSAYLIANSILDKSNALLYLKNFLVLDLIIDNSSFNRGDTISVRAGVEVVNGSAGIDNIPFMLNDSVNSFTAYLDKDNGGYSGSFELPVDALLSSWRVWVNHSSDLFNVISDVEFFNVLPTNLVLRLESDRFIRMGSHSLRVSAGYANNEFFAGNVINATVTPPESESFNVQLNPCGSVFCKDLLFNEPGEWLINLAAEDSGNTGYFNTSVIVSDELMIEVVDSSLLSGENASIIVSVDDVVDKPSFSLSGLPGGILRVVEEGGLYRLFLDVNLTIGDYDFTIRVSDDSGNQGFVDGVLVVNDLVLESSVNDSLISGSVGLSDGTPLATSVELYIDGELVESVTSSPQGGFSFNEVLTGYALVIARYEGLVKSELFIINQSKSPVFSVGDVLIEFPLLIESNGTSVSSSINFSSDYSTPVTVFFNQSSIPEWVVVPEEVVVPPAGASALLNVFPSNISSGAYPLSISGLVADELFTKSFVIIVNDEVTHGNLSINSVSFDLNNSGLVIHVSNPDSSSHELLVNSSGNSSPVIISAFTDGEVFIPFADLSADLSLVTGDSVLFRMSDVVGVESFSNEAVDYLLIIFFLVIGYPVLIFSFLGWLYSDNIVLFFKRKLKK